MWEFPLEFSAKRYPGFGFTQSLNGKLTHLECFRIIYEVVVLYLCLAEHVCSDLYGVAEILKPCHEKTNKQVSKQFRQKTSCISS